MTEKQKVLISKVIMLIREIFFSCSSSFANLLWKNIHNKSFRLKTFYTAFLFSIKKGKMLICFDSIVPCFVLACKRIFFCPWEIKPFVSTYIQKDMVACYYEQPLHLHILSIQYTHSLELRHHCKRLRMIRVVWNYLFLAKHQNSNH